MLQKITKEACQHLKTSLPYVIPNKDDPGNLIPADLKGGQCVHPLARDIEMINHLLKSGMSPEWIAKFFTKTGGLKGIVDYYKSLHLMMKKLAPALSLYGAFSTSDIILPNEIGQCKSRVVDATLASIFCDDDEKEDILTISRMQGGNHFVDLLWATGLAGEILSSKMEYTFIVPKDGAFKSLSLSMREKLKNSCYLRQVLQYHISKGSRSSDDIKENGSLLTMHLDKSLVYDDVSNLPTLNGNEITSSNHMSKQGFVHTINRLLFPEINDKKFV